MQLHNMTYGHTLAQDQFTILVNPYYILVLSLSDHCLKEEEIFKRIECIFTV